VKLSANKGEWSELYVLIRLLADGKIFTADENLTSNQNCYLPILKIFRDEDRTRHIEYRRNDNKDFIELYLNNDFIRRIKTEELAAVADSFFQATKNGQGKGSFQINGAKEIMKSLCCQKIKAAASEKIDIQMQVHDPFTNFNRICGYSIKSDIGSAPTLFNAAQATNFKFEVSGVSDEQMQEINAIDKGHKLIARMKKIPELKFVCVVDETFAKNLLFIDTQMEIILAEMLKLFYGENISDCAALATELGRLDPLHFNVESLYRHKIKKFLCAVALGLTPTTQWNGLDEANGGYIIVKESGSVIAYHLYNRDSFETYLLNNTKLDKGSSSRHDFGSIYVEDGRKFINLNLQVRFK